LSNEKCFAHIYESNGFISFSLPGEEIGVIFFTRNNDLRLREAGSLFHFLGGDKMKANWKPLADKVLIRRIEESDQKVGGIIIPDTAKEKPQQGEVIAVGPGRVNEKGKRIPLEVKKGQKVLFGKYSGTEITVEDQEYLFIDADDIMAILE